MELHSMELHSNENARLRLALVIPIGIPIIFCKRCNRSATTCY